MSNRAVPLFLMLGSPLQLLVIVLILILLFGAGRLGAVGKGLGEGIRNFKRGLAGGDDAKGKAEGIPPANVSASRPASAEAASPEPSKPRES